MTSERTISRHLGPVAAVLLCLLGWSPAYAIVAPDGYYFNMFGGGSFLPSIKSSIFPLLPAPIVQPVNKLQFKGGTQLGGALGYKYGPFRLEGILAWNHIEHQSLNKQRIGGSLVLLSGFVNAYYDFDFIEAQTDADDFIPYVGLGAGYSRIRRNFTVFQPNLKVTDDEFSYSVILGTQYNADSETTFALDYRFIGTGTATNTYNKSLGIHTINLSLTHHMDHFIFD